MNPVHPGSNEGAETGDLQPPTDVTELLRQTRIEVAPATYYLIGLRHEDWTRLLETLS